MQLPFSGNILPIVCILSYQSDHKAVKLAHQFIQNFLDRYHHKRGPEDARLHWENFLSVPENLGAFSGTRVAIIIDEFQDMRFYIHDVEKTRLDHIHAVRQQDPDYSSMNLPASYSPEIPKQKGSAAGFRFSGHFDFQNRDGRAVGRPL